MLHSFLHFLCSFFKSPIHSLKLNSNDTLVARHPLLVAYIAHSTYHTGCIICANVFHWTVDSLWALILLYFLLFPPRTSRVSSISYFHNLCCLIKWVNLSHCFGPWLLISSQCFLVRGIRSKWKIGVKTIPEDSGEKRGENSVFSFSLNFLCKQNASLDQTPKNLNTFCLHNQK